MTQDATMRLARALRRVRIALPGVRWLGLQDEDGQSLRHLIKACYADTYSYKTLYEPGGLEGLWDSGALLSLGEFSRQGELIGHTGFWTKDPGLDYLESGLSLVSPSRRQGLRVDYQRVWRPLLEALGQHVSYVHQNTTTLHPMAQFYALKHMKARPTGFIPWYAHGERVMGLSESGAVMHALSMTTPLGSEAALPVVAPRSPWRPWLKAVAQGAGLTVEGDEGPRWSGQARVDSIERNGALRLLRHAIKGGEDGLDDVLPGLGGARVQIVHVPAVSGLSGLFDALLTRGFVPTGVRPHKRRAHEWTLQRVPDPQALSGLGEVQLATEGLRSLWQDWRERCAHTL